MEDLFNLANNMLGSTSTYHSQTPFGILCIQGKDSKEFIQGDMTDFMEEFYNEKGRFEK